MPKRPFAWSISRLSSYEICPRRHAEVDLLKNFREPPSPAMEFGGALHKSLELATSQGQPLPTKHQEYQDVVDKVVALDGDKEYELRFGLTRDFEPCEFFADDVWLRIITDVLIFSEDGTRAAVLDYKTGKIKPDMSQLMLNAAVVFHYYKKVQTIDVAYWWLTKGNKLTKGKYHRKDLPEIWAKFLPRVKEYEVSYNADSFPPQPGRFCANWCPVTTCPHHGGG